MQFDLNCSECLWPVGGPQAASHCEAAAQSSVGAERLPQPRGVAQPAAGMRTYELPFEYTTLV